MADLPDLPVFWDLADGIGGNLGTANAPGQLIIQGPDGADDYVLQESPTSPEFERAEQGTVTKTFTDIPWLDSCTYMVGLSRGAILIDSTGLIFRILSSKQNRLPGNKATISIVSESLSFDTPPDEFQIVPVELGVDILRHPRYRLALDPTISDITTPIDIPGDAAATVSASTVKQAIIRAIQTYRDSPIFPSADNINGLFQNNVVANMNDDTISVLYPNPSFDVTKTTVDPVFWDGSVANTPTDNCRYFIVNVPVSDDEIQFCLAAAKEIILKIWRTEDTPLLTGYEVAWSAYYPVPQPMNPGSYIENPMTEASPALPDYFWAANHDLSWAPPREGSPTPQGLPDEVGVFDDLATINPQCYDDGSGVTNISWLRKADEVEFNRCWFKITRKWLGAPIGNWDGDLYSQSARPNIGNYTEAPPIGYRQLTS